jgi:cellobiose dehydrogenase (acceptor)
MSFSGVFEYGWAQNIGAPDNPGDPANAVIYRKIPYI